MSPHRWKNPCRKIHRPLSRRRVPRSSVLPPRCKWVLQAGPDHQSSAYEPAFQQTPCFLPGTGTLGQQYILGVQQDRVAVHQDCKSRYPRSRCQERLVRPTPPVLLRGRLPSRRGAASTDWLRLDPASAFRLLRQSCQASQIIPGRAIVNLPRRPYRNHGLPRGRH